MNHHSSFEAAHGSVTCFSYQETVLASLSFIDAVFYSTFLGSLEFLMLYISSYFVNRDSKVSFAFRKQDFHLEEEPQVQKY